MRCRHSGNIAVVVIMQKRGYLFDLQKGMIIDIRAKVGYISRTTEFLNSHCAVVKNTMPAKLGDIEFVLQEL